MGLYCFLNSKSDQLLDKQIADENVVEGKSLPVSPLFGKKSLIVLSKVPSQ